MTGREVLGGGVRGGNGVALPEQSGGAASGGCWWGLELVVDGPFGDLR